MAYGSADHRSGQRPAGVVEPSRGVWAFTADVDLLRRLAASGFDWVALDAQHGPVDRAALHAVGAGPGGCRRPRSSCACRPSTRSGSAPPWMPVPTAVVVPSVTGRADAVLAARASRYPPEGDRSWGPFAPLWGGAAPDPAAANAAVRCLRHGRDGRCPGRRRRDRGDPGRRRAVRRPARPRPRPGHHGRRAPRRPVGRATRSAGWSPRRRGTASSWRGSRAPRRTRGGCGRTASTASR